MSLDEPAVKAKITNSSVLHDTIKFEDKETIFEVLQQHCDYLKTTDENGDTLLHSLFKNEKLNPSETTDILSVILDLGLDLNIQNKRGLTVLTTAVAREMKPAIDLLIERGAMQSVTDNTKLRGNTVAHFFVNNEYEKYVEVSKLKGPGVLVCDRQSMEEESASFAEYLISKGFDFDHHNFNGESALHLAIKMNLQHILPTLLRHSTDINFIKKRVNKNLLHLFLEADKPSAPIKFPRQYAIDIVKILLDRGVSADSVCADDKSALELALQTYKEVKIIDMIFDRFTDVHRKNQFGQSLLHRVIQRRLRSHADSQEYLKIVRSLVRKGFNVDCEDESGTRPIHLAFDQAQCVEELLDVFVKAGGCDVNAARKNGQTALYLAIEKCNLPVMQKLIRHGADVNVSGKVMAPLILALKKGYLDVVKILLKNGADVNCKDAISGKRPLHFVLDWNCDVKVRDEYVKMLLKGGAYVNARDNEKKSVLAWAIKSRNSTGVRELLEYGADLKDSCVTGEMDALVNKHGVDMFTRNLIDNMVDSVVKHWIKIMTVGRSSGTCKSFVEGTKYQQFYRDCLLERETLKGTLIDARISLHQWMHMGPNKRCRYINNEDLKSIVDSPVLQVQFPLYAIVVVGNYREAVARKSLLGLAKDAWLEATGIGLPDICMEGIFSYMSNADLVDMM